MIKITKTVTIGLLIGAIQPQNINSADSMRNATTVMPEDTPYEENSYPLPPYEDM